MTDGRATGTCDAQEHALRQVAEPGRMPGGLLLVLREGECVAQGYERGVCLAAGADNAVAAVAEYAQDGARLAGRERRAGHGGMRLYPEDEVIDRADGSVIAAVPHTGLQNQYIASEYAQL